MPVVRAIDGSYRVGGDTDVYTIFRSSILGGWVCSCAARTNRCSHVLAVELSSDLKGPN